MNKIRFSIRLLLASVALIGSACAAVRFPTFFCASLTLSILLSLLVGAIVVSVTCRGACQAFWLCFAVAGGAHLILALMPWFGTSKLLFSRYCLDRLALPLDYTMSPNAYVDEATLKSAVQDYVPGSPPDRYYKYIVIGQSMITLFLATVAGMLGQLLYRHQLTRDQLPPPHG